MSKIKKEPKRNKFPIEQDCWKCGAVLSVDLIDIYYIPHVYSVSNWTNCPKCGEETGVDGLDYLTKQEVKRNHPYSYMNSIDFKFWVAFIAIVLFIIISSIFHSS